MATTWVVETGAYVAGANTYFSMASVAAYCSERNYTEWASASTAKRDNAMHNAMAFIESQPFKGFKFTYNQYLKWPRYNCYDEDGFYDNVKLIPYGLPLIPLYIKYALAQACYEEVKVPGCLMPTQTQADFVKSKRIDVLSWEYSKVVTGTIYPAIMAYLNPYLRPKGSVVVNRS